MQSETDRQLESFIEAFRDRVASSRATCHCGRMFYNPDNGWDWEEGELERLADDASVTALNWAVSYISFEGRTFIVDCDCWHERAKRLMAFISGHDEKIADFLTAERRRRQDEANRSPTVG